jgi:tetrahydromethanopterin S-methyltransferase subunit A
MVTHEPAPSSTRPGWPLVSGRYIVGNPARSVAICTLASSDLVDQIGAREEIAIVGRLYTLNLGLEKLVWNIIANPAIRFLLLCGDDTTTSISQGIVHLHARGFDAEHRIPEVRGYQPIVPNLTSEEVSAFQQQVELVSLIGYQPIVPNLTSEEVSAFQQQVELVSLIGETDVETILAAARQLQVRAPGPWGPGIRHPFPEPTAATRNRMGDIRLDPRGLFLVGLRRDAGEIILDHYSADRRYLAAVVGTDAEAICHTLVREGLLSELSHAAYLGREVAKAEEALRWGLEYEQDRPLFVIGQGGPWAPFGRRAERPAGEGRQTAAAPRDETP